MGLTASPVMGSNPAEMKDLEKILDAVCRTPTMHRDELLAHSNRPELSHIVYPAVDVDYLPRTPAMMSLFEIMSSLSLDNDPYVVELKIFDKLPQNQRKLDKVYNPKTEGNYETRVQIQARAFCRRVDEMNRELGHWAADHYIAEVVRRFAAIADREASHSPPPATTAQEGAISATMNWGARIRPKENRYLAWMLSQVCVTPPDPSMLVNARPPTLSGKLQRLIDLLSEPRTTNEKIVGIIFVEQRTTVVLLAHILSLHPATSQRFRVGRLVGTSKNDKRARAEMADVLEAATSRDLERFRAGNLNLLVTTSVAEEGIDIPSCNLVICFDEPQKLTSFIQRRGRARMKRSRLIVFTEEASTSETGGNTRGRKVIDWPALEAEMKRQFDRDETERNEIRRLEEAAEIEAANSAADTLKPIFSSVGARLDMDNARARLEHFCAKVLRRSAFVDHKPEFIVSETPSVDATTTTLAAANNHANNSMSNNAPITATTSTTAVTPSKRRRRAAAAAQAQSQEPPALRAVPKLLTATVILPAGLPDSLRTFKSSRAWLSERAACKDAAFAACAALYEEGFLNDHFLPVTAEESMGSEGGELDELAGLTRIVEGRDSLVEVLQRRSGWEQVVETKWWADRHYLGNVGGKEEIVYAREIRLRDADGAVTATAELLLPVRTPSEMKGFHLWWDETREGYVEFGAEREVPTQFRERERMGLYMRETKELIGLAYGHRWRFEDDDLVVRFASPCACRTEKPQVTFQLSEGLLRSMPGCLIRDGFGCLYEYRGWLPSRPPRHLVRKAGRDYDDWPEDEPYITCDKYSRRTDFIHRLPPSTDSNQSTEKEELSGGDAEAEVESEPRYSYVIPARECTIEPADRALVDLSRALPCITHVVETWMLAMTLQRTLLADVGICNLELVLTAITARSAREVRDYERLELLGDSILKLYATLNVAARCMWRL